VGLPVGVLLGTAVVVKGGTVCGLAVETVVMGLAAGVPVAVALDVDAGLAELPGFVEQAANGKKESRSSTARPIFDAHANSCENRAQ
jgi:hypothetical protein